jgi:HTH-like domain/Integrase core domain
VSAFVDQERERFGVEPICRELEVSPSAYYQRRAGPASRRVTEDASLTEQIRRVHKANYEAYGSRRVWKALRREGVDVGRDRVRRLMRATGLQGAKRRGKPWRTTVPDPTALRPPDLVERDFSASRSNELWVCDFTYGRCWEGVVYFAFVKDAYSRMICGWQFATHMRTELVLDALEMALWGPASRRPSDPSLRPGKPIHELPLHPATRGRRRGGIGGLGRGCLRQRARRELRRLVQDRAAEGSCLAHEIGARAGDRGIRALVQPRAPAREPR